jgi:hypothetical protein
MSLQGMFIVKAFLTVRADELEYSLVCIHMGLPANHGFKLVATKFTVVHFVHHLQARMSNYYF